MWNFDIIRIHVPDLWRPKSNQFPLESKWTLVPNLEKFPEGFLEFPEFTRLGRMSWQPEKKKLNQIIRKAWVSATCSDDTISIVSTGFLWQWRETLLVDFVGVFSEISSSSWNIMAYNMLQNNIFGFPAFIFFSKLDHSSCARYKDSQFWTNSNCL